jgi:hypothetical protein
VAVVSAAPRDAKETIMRILELEGEDPDRRAFCMALAERLANRIAMNLPPGAQSTVKLTFYEIITYAVTDYDAERDLRRSSRRWRADGPHDGGGPRSA